MEQGHFNQAIETIKKSIQLSEQGNLPHLQLSSGVDLGWLYGYLGDLERGLELGRQAQDKQPELLEKPGKPLCFSAPHSGLGMKGQNLSFIISSMGLFFKKNPIER